MAALGHLAAGPTYRHHGHGVAAAAASSSLRLRSFIRKHSSCCCVVCSHFPVSSAAVSVSEHWMCLLCMHACRGLRALQQRHQGRHQRQGRRRAMESSRSPTFLTSQQKFGFLNVSAEICGKLLKCLSSPCTSSLCWKEKGCYLCVSKL